MQLKRITDAYAVDGQILPSDMKVIADEGFKSVINNRPDNEEPGQALESDLRAAAEAAGLSYHFIPMTMPTLSPELVAEHNAAIEAAEGAVVAFCRSGTRSTVLWALTQFCYRNKQLSELASAAGAQGYDLSGMGPLLESYRAALND